MTSLLQRQCISRFHTTDRLHTLHAGCQHLLTGLSAATPTCTCGQAAEECCESPISCIAIPAARSSAAVSDACLLESVSKGNDAKAKFQSGKRCRQEVPGLSLADKHRKQTMQNTSEAPKSTLKASLSFIASRSTPYVKEVTSPMQQCLRIPKLTGLELPCHKLESRAEL